MQNQSRYYITLILHSIEVIVTTAAIKVKFTLITKATIVGQPTTCLLPQNMTLSSQGSG